MPTLVRGTLVVFFGALASSLFNIAVLKNQFTILPGDLGDTRLIIYLLEHWFKTLQGLTPWNQVGFFFPDPNTLGFSESFFLLGLVYSLPRYLSVDPYNSYQIVYLVLPMIGFVGFYLVFRRTFRLPFFVCLLAGLFLTSLSPLKNQSGHGQMMTTFFLPYLYLLGSQGLFAPKRPVLAIAWSSLFAAIFMTSFYVGWFYGLCMIIFFFINTAQTLIQRRMPIAVLTRGLRPYRFSLPIALSSFCVFMIPFIQTYSPLIKSGAKREFAEVMSHAPTLSDLINVSQSNVLWRRAYQSLYYQFSNVEVTGGYSPIWAILMVMILFSLALKQNRGPLRSKKVMLLALTTVFFTVLPLKFFEQHSLWGVVYHLVPGGTAIRAIGRFSILSSIAAATLTVVFLHQWLLERTKKVALAFTICIGILLADNLSLGHFSLKKAPEINRYNWLISLPRVMVDSNSLLINGTSLNSNCQSFYVVKTQEFQEKATFPDEHHTEALTISMATQLPTLNGYSGNTPPNWHLGTTMGKEYEDAAQDWIQRNDLHHVCSWRLRRDRK